MHTLLLFHCLWLLRSRSQSLSTGLHLSLNSESAEIHIKMHSAAAHYRQTPQTSEAKPFSERKSPEQQDLLKAQKRKYFETLSYSFFYVFQAEQSKTVDSPNPSQGAPWGD